MVGTFFCRLLLVALILPFGSLHSAKAIESSGWVTCLYNNTNKQCRRKFLCKDAPCDRFELVWRDGVSDIYSLIRDVASNVAYYKDARGGKWLLRAYAGSFALVNQANGNTIVYDMTLQACRQSGLSDLCGD
jgi:hypothetical protein